MNVVLVLLLFLLPLDMYRNGPAERREYRAVLVGANGAVLVLMVGMTLLDIARGGWF